jgi:hypothetical protein
VRNGYDMTESKPKFDLTAIQEAYRKKVLAAECMLQVAQEELTRVVKECKHVLRPLSDGELEDEWMSIWARCSICGKDYGHWRCKKSPDSVCHYYSHDDVQSTRVIDLLDGKIAPIPTGHDRRFESEDHCIFCGMPDERK